MFGYQEHLEPVTNNFTIRTIVDKARSIGLDVAALKPTLGDGNCFYHAVIEALSRTDRPYHGDHINLRYEVVLFVEQNQNQDFVTLWQSTILNEDLDSVIARQYLSGTYASELFIRACAIKLNIAIL